MSRYGYLKVFKSPLEFEITRVDCIIQSKTNHFFIWEQFNPGLNYGNCPNMLFTNFSDKMANANSADPAQTAPKLD